MEHQLPSLPYPKGALEPHISAETLEYHYGKHHKAYVTKLNDLIRGTEFENLPLEDIIMRSDGPLFNNAAQHWNHSFFWKCLNPEGGEQTLGAMSELIKENFESLEKFQDAFSKAAMANFGSGWTWLIQKEDGSLEIMNTSNADNPLKHGLKPILTLDVWEHAYYIDYRNSRQDFINAFWKLVNWEFVNGNLMMSDRDLLNRQSPDSLNAH